MSWSSSRYDPRTFKALSFHDAAQRFRDSTDTPRAYLERCLEMVREREPIVKAFIALNEAGARKSYRDLKHYRRRKRWLS